jgi:hypothetical protein
MVSQVLAHARQVLDHVYIQAPEMAGRAHAGKHQQLWRPYGPAAQYDLLSLRGERLPSALGFYSYGTTAFKQDAPGHYVRPDGEVKPVAGRVEISQGRADTDAITVVQRSG